MVEKIKKRNKKSIDLLLLGAILFLCIVGLAIVGSSSWPASIKEGAQGNSYVTKHFLFLGLGLVAMFIGAKLPIKLIKRLAFPAWLISLLFCSLLYTDLAITVQGSARWLKIPILNFQFMPADLLKYTSILFFSGLLEAFRNHGKREGGFYLIFALGITVLVVIIKDFSTASVIAFTLFALYFIAGMNLSELLIFIIGGVLGVWLMLIRYPYRMERLMSFKDPFDDIANTDWQLANSLYALGMGGLSGVGFLKSRQKFSYIPEAYNDFIFAILGEEFGLLGTFLIVLIYGVIVYRGLKIALNQKKMYEKLVASGITIAIGIQAFFNMGVVTGILPVTGITLPFISYGGTSLILTMGMSGILIGLSKNRGES